MPSFTPTKKALDLLAQWVPVPVMRKAHAMARAMEREAFVQDYIGRCVPLMIVASIAIAAGAVLLLFWLLAPYTHALPAASTPAQEVWLFVEIAVLLVLVGVLHMRLLAWLRTRALEIYDSSRSSQDSN